MGTGGDGWGRVGMGGDGWGWVGKVGARRDLDDVGASLFLLLPPLRALTLLCCSSGAPIAPDHGSDYNWTEGVVGQRWGAAGGTCSSVGLLALVAANSACARRILLYCVCTRDGSRIVRACSCSARLIAARTQNVA